MSRYVIPILTALRKIVTKFEEFLYDKIKILDRVTGKLYYTTSESLSLFIRTISRFLVLVKLSLNIQEQVISLLKGISKDLIKLKDLLTGKFISIINESISLIIRIISKLLIKIQIVINITEEVKLILKKLFPDIIRLLDKVTGKFLSSINETINLVIKIISKFFYKVYLTLSISENIIKGLKGIGKDFFNLLDYLTGKFLKNIEETIYLSIKALSRLFYKVNITLSISESIKNILKRLLQDFIKFSDSLIVKFTKKVEESISLVIRIISKVFYKFYLTLNITEHISRIVKCIGRDFTRLSDSLKGRLLRTISETITLSIRILYSLKPYKIYLTLSISEWISRVKKGSPVLYDQHIFDEVIFN